MKSRLNVLLTVTVVLGLRLPANAQPPRGSQLPREENGCAICHGEESLWIGPQRRLYVPWESLSGDVHRIKGVNCHDCHGGDPSTLDVADAHNTQSREQGVAPPFRETPQQVRSACGSCHSEIALQLRKSVHARAERQSDNAPGDVLQCGRCHGEKVHGMLPVHDARSPVHLDNQVATCGGCHEQDQESYRRTIHGASLYGSGLVITAVCANCHGSHAIYYAADERSTLHVANVADTCGECHQGIEAIIEQSVHGGSKEFMGRQSESSQERWERSPTCTDCHQGHRLLKASSAAYRAEVTNYCGNCHPDLTGRYAMSTHGKLTELGHTAAAKCHDCHGAHDILRVEDPASRLAPGANRLDTCRNCHVRAVMNFSQFDPHADYKDAEKYPSLYRVYSFTHTLFFAFMAFFVIHAFLWFVRSFLTALRHGRHRPLSSGQHVIERYPPANRIVYVILLVSFLGLTATGLPLKYSTQQWAQVYVKALGGFEYTSFWHHIFGALALGCCIAHIVYVARSISKLRSRGLGWRQVLGGPDSPVPGPRDAKDLFGMLKWFLGLGPKPTFERWAYWEKYDYWMAFLACILVGGSGLIMWYPNLFCRFISGETLNLVRVIHVELAVLATSFLFVFHFFHTHFRPEKFPLDLSAVTGLVSEEHLRRQRPEYLARLEATGQLAGMRRPAPARRQLWLVFSASAVIFLIGIGLLAVALTAALGK